MKLSFDEKHLSREILALTSPFRFYGYDDNDYDMTFWKINVDTKLSLKSSVNHPIQGRFFEKSFHKPDMFH